MTPLLAVLLLAQATPQDTAAGRPCRVAVDSMGHFAQTTRAGGDTTSHGGGGVLAQQCRDCGYLRSIAIVRRIAPAGEELRRLLRPQTGHHVEH